MYNLLSADPPDLETRLESLVPRRVALTDQARGTLFGQPLIQWWQIEFCILDEREDLCLFGRL